ncbi:hypothetical protein lerEdw1_010647 [Lerista edwardsae]|nr:hypothetical protein lerEdw1_010647 [Lerista edwardsae]
MLCCQGQAPKPAFLRLQSRQIFADALKLTCWEEEEKKKNNQNHALLSQVESWNKHDQKLFDAVEKGDVGRVSALASKKTARPTKPNALGQSAYVSLACPMTPLAGGAAAS